MTAPTDPRKAVKKSGCVFTISLKAMMAGAVVNTEVKNMPARKLAASSSLAETRKL